MPPPYWSRFPSWCSQGKWSICPFWILNWTLAFFLFLLFVLLYLLFLPPLSSFSLPFSLSYAFIQPGLRHSRCLHPYSLRVARNIVSHSEILCLIQGILEYSGAVILCLLPHIPHWLWLTYSNLLPPFSSPELQNKTKTKPKKTIKSTTHGILTLFLIRDGEFNLLVFARVNEMHFTV